MLSFFKFGRDAEHDVAAMSDLRAFFAQERETNWPIRIASVVIPVTLFGGFIYGMAGEHPYRAPDIVFVKNWSSSRSDAEIRAQQARDAPAERAARKAEYDALEARRSQFRKLGNSMGIDEK